MKNKIAEPTPTGVFLLVFAWSFIVGLLIQWVILPAMPSLYAGHGLMKGGDWLEFHSEASKLAELMQRHGWQIWELRPRGNAPIGIAAAVYFFTGISEPWILLPLNAALFALSAVCLHRIFTLLVPGRLAFMAILPFVLFPSAAMIYSQIHKDVFSIAGILAVILVWVEFARFEKTGWRSVLRRIALIGAGGLLVWIVRPYLLQPLIAASVLAALLMGIIEGQKRRTIWWVGILLCLLVMAGSNRFPDQSATLIAPLPPIAPAQSTAPAQPATVVAPIISAAPAYLDRAVTQLNLARRGFTEGSPNAGSNIDGDVRFASLSDIVEYVPRAVQVGVFAPFPSMWLSDGVSIGSNIMRLISGMEMIVSYVLLIGIGLLLYGLKTNRLPLVVAILMAMVLIIVVSLVVPNVGTLYRMRYGSWHLLNGLGVLGWGVWWQRRRMPTKSTAFP